MVIWRDGEQQWRCFEDKCPHRWLLSHIQAHAWVPFTPDMLCAHGSVLCITAKGQLPAYCRPLQMSERTL